MRSIRSSHSVCFYDATRNPQVFFHNMLAGIRGQDVIIDERTGLMWQQGGLDLCSIRSMKQKIDTLNRQKFVGYNDWRLPALEEALSLMEAEENSKGVYCHAAFQQNSRLFLLHRVGALPDTGLLITNMAKLTGHQVLFLEVLPACVVI